MRTAFTFVVLLGTAIAAPVENAYPSLAGRQNDLGAPVDPFIPTETGTTTTTCDWGTETTPTPTISLEDNSPLGPFDGAAGLQKRQFVPGDSFFAFLDDLTVLIDAAMSEAVTAETSTAVFTTIADTTIGSVASEIPTSVADDTLGPLGPIDNKKEKRQSDLIQPVTGLLLGGLGRKRQLGFLGPLSGLLDGLTGIAGGLGGGAPSPQATTVPVTSEATTITDATFTSTSLVTTVSSALEADATPLDDFSDIGFDQKRDNVPDQSKAAADKIGDVTTKLNNASQNLTPDEQDQLGAKAIEAYCARYDPQCCWLSEEDTDKCTWDF
ncbi:hypothetical protein NW762_014579 [Fusarium torreyae]|uniref:Uncharacterized protein n=1 Tax=Fusarium torreyae TaxID=1237075 RepID=A0A9W8RMJ2_9HYPO|nr:hypothetical protein NW762_014579 [Fusarium torreyae]